MRRADHSRSATSRERELKFAVPPERVAGVERALRAAGARLVRLHALYLDTAGDALARQGIALRLRREGRSWLQTVKLRGRSSVSRPEHEVPVATPRGVVPTVDPARHRGSEAGDALARALARCPDGSALQTRFAIDVRRLVLDVPVGDAVVEVAFDRGTIVADGRAQPLAEVEYELKRGPPSALRAPACRGIDDHGLWLSTISKPEQAQRMLHGEVLVPAASKRGGSATPATTIAAAVEQAVETLLRQATAVAGGAVDDEAVHQLRVAIRRLRSLLRVLAPLLQGVDAAWDAVLGATARDLGACRDAVAVVAATRGWLETAGAPSVPPPQPPSDDVEPAEIARRPAFQKTLVALATFALDPLAPDLGDARIAALVRRRIVRLHRLLAAAAGRFAELDESAQHRARKRLKRLRYVAEAAAPMFAGRRMARLLAALKRAQDALGLHHDTIVGREAYRRVAVDQDPRAWFAVGWLTSHATSTAEGGRRALKRVARKKPPN